MARAALLSIVDYISDYLSDDTLSIRRQLRLAGHHTTLADGIAPVCQRGDEEAARALVFLFLPKQLRRIAHAHRHDVCIIAGIFSPYVESPVTNLPLAQPIQGAVLTERTLSNATANYRVKVATI